MYKKTFTFAFVAFYFRGVILIYRCYLSNTHKTIEFFFEMKRFIYSQSFVEIQIEFTATIIIVSLIMSVKWNLIARNGHHSK